MFKFYFNYNYKYLQISTVKKWWQVHKHQKFEYYILYDFKI